MSRPEVLAFLSDIKTNPADDTPRLILADWLTDQDDPRGEFIRLQCQLARMEETDPGRPALRQRESELQEAHESDWLGPVFPVMDKVGFHRGLLTVEARIQKLRGKYAKPLPDCEEWAWVETLKLRGNAKALAALCGTPLLDGIVTLHFVGGFLSEKQRQLDDKGLRTLGGSSYLQTLTTLILRSVKIEDGSDLSPLLPLFSRLTSLDLRHCHLGDRIILALAGLVSQPRLTCLELCGNYITALGVKALVASTVFQGLTWLSLNWNLVGDAGALALASAPHLARLTYLDLRGNGITDVGALALAHSSTLRGLTTLGLGLDELSEQTQQAIRQRFTVEE